MSIARVPSSPVRPKTDEACTRASACDRDRPSIAHRSHIDRPSIAHPTWPGLKSSLITIGGVTPPVPEPATCWSVDRCRRRRKRVDRRRRRRRRRRRGRCRTRWSTGVTTTTEDDRRHCATTTTEDDTTRTFRYTTTIRIRVGPVRHATHAKGQRPFVRGGFDLISNHAHDAGWGGLIAPRVGVFYT